MRPAESERRPMGTYVIVRQGDGNATLAHAAPGFQAKTERPGHKYILRIVNAIGTRYFYTKDQVQAYYNEQKKKMQSAKSAYDNYQKEATKETWAELQKHPAALKTEMARRKVAEAGENIEYYGNQAKEAVKKVVSSNKKDEPKNTAESARSRPATKQEQKADDHTERLQGRKRNVTGTADPIQKGEATGLGPVGQNDKPIEEKTNAEPNRKKTDKDEMPTADQQYSYVQDRIDNLNNQITSYNEELDKLEASGHGSLKDQETQAYLKHTLPKMVGEAAASYVITNTEREQADHGMKDSYESLQKDLQAIQNDPNASAQTKRYAEKIERELKEYQEAVDTYNMLCDQNPGGMSKKAQKAMKAELEKKRDKLIKDGEYKKSDASWATDSINASLDAYRKVSNSSMYTRDEMMSYGGLIESMLLTWQKAGLTQEDWDENFKLH